MQLEVGSHPRSPAVLVNVLAVWSETAGFFDRLLLIFSRLNSIFDTIVWICDALGSGLGRTSLKVLMTLSACILREIHNRLEGSSACSADPSK
jgi:hypothetical protein